MTLMKVILLDSNFDIPQHYNSFHSCLYIRHTNLPLIYFVYKMSAKRFRFTVWTFPHLYVWSKINLTWYTSAAVDLRLRFASTSIIFSMKTNWKFGVRPICRCGLSAGKYGTWPLQVSISKVSANPLILMVLCFQALYGGEADLYQALDDSDILLDSDISCVDALQQKNSCVIAGAVTHCSRDCLAVSLFFFSTVSIFWVSLIYFFQFWMFVFQFTFTVRVECNSVAIVPVMARLMTVTANSSVGNGLEQIIVTFKLCQMVFWTICASKKLTFSTSSCLWRSRGESILRVVVMLEFYAVAVLLQLANYVVLYC